MRSRIRSGLTYANVMATVAVFLALGGGAYAAIKLPKNSVGAKQLKKGAVRSSKIKPGSVRGNRLRKNTLTGKQVKENRLGTVPTAAFARNAQSAKNAQRAQLAGAALHADDASTLAGKVVKPITGDIPRGTNDMVLAKVGPVSVLGSCGTAPTGPVTVKVSSTASGDFAYAGFDSSGGFEGHQTGGGGGTTTVVNSATIITSAAAIAGGGGGRSVAAHFIAGFSPDTNTGCFVSGTLAG